jgi:lipopolysaccharide/colanic/teichoic acid biosynthesis glycosyltransferase
VEDRGRPWVVVVDSASKRVMDVAGATVLLLVLLPLFAALAVVIKLESRGPVFFRCRRIGRRGAPITVLKFRKMHEDASGPPLTMADDPRFTRLGGFLARTKLDEVPQLWNVIRGDMSLVGPRPEDTVFVQHEARHYERILAVRPGITGLSQLAFARESKILVAQDSQRDYVDRLLPQKVRMDTLYAEQRTLLMDVRILLWTTPAVLGVDVAVNRESGRLTLRRRRRVPDISPAHDQIAPVRMPAEAASEQP